MKWLPVFCALFLCGVGYAEDTKFDDAVEKYVTNCKETMQTKGNVMLAYYYINPPTYGEILSFNVANFNVKSELKSEKAKSEVLLKAACICTDIAINTYDYIVVPFILNDVTKDALTLCMFHDDDTKYDDVFTFPVSLLSSWMMAQYMSRMPRTLLAPASESSSDCIDYYGNPTATIPNQKACYYVNYAVFEEIEGRIETISRNAYYGPFLGSQYPDFRTLQDLAESKTPILDFMTEFDYVLCSLIKNDSRLSRSIYKTGCRHKVFNNAHKVVIVACCCIGQYDPNCNEVTEAVKHNKTICLDGELSSGSTSFYFASQCPFTAVKEYKRVLPFDTGDSFEHRQALAILSVPTMHFDSSQECSLSYATQCKEMVVEVIHNGCCSGNGFCNLQAGLTSNIQRCILSFGENQETSGCAIIFYRANNQWVRSSTVWFDMEKSKLIHLYTSETATTIYNVSLAFLVNKNVATSCPEQTHRYSRQYYAITCAARSCDYDFNDFFFSFLHESIINRAIDESTVPRCEAGNMLLTTDNITLDQLPLLTNTTRVIGIYCKLDLRISVIRNKKTVDVSFGPAFPMTPECNTHEGHFEDLKLTCCYEGSSNMTHVEPACHYSTILSVVRAMFSKAKSGDEGLVTLDPVEPTPQNIRQGVYEHADLCEQSHIGHVGKVSRRCYPGGHGCFHLNGLTDTNDAVIASCIGRAEKYVATHDDAFDQYHEALICLVEEAQGKCHLVHSGSRQMYLCCCKATVIRNNIARCEVDSNMLFNTHKYEVKYVESFKDNY